MDRLTLNAGDGVSLLDKRIYGRLCMNRYEVPALAGPDRLKAGLHTDYFGS